SELKASAYAELGRLHMLNYEVDQAAAAAGVATEMADRLGLDDVRAHAAITTVMARYLTGDADALRDLSAIVDLCRRRQLTSYRRAAQNLGVALQEEGDTAGSRRLLDESRAAGVGGGHGRSTNYSDEAMWRYFTGQSARMLAAADAFLTTPAGEWELQLRSLCAWVR